MINVLQMELTKMEGRTYTDYSYQMWQEFPLDNIATSYVKITVLSVYTSHKNGFIEVEFYVSKSKRYYYLNIVLTS